MASAQNPLIRLTDWLIRRNPTYLLSAACIAVGARLLLVHPDSRTGDVGLILATLGVLQLYESLVCSALILLHRYRKSPEDLPSLMLVSVAFWTGPMAATIEMTTHRSNLGLALAMPAMMIALLEMRKVISRLRIPISFASQVAAASCLLLLAIAPSLLKVSAADPGIREVRMYFAWWVPAFIALLPLAARRQPTPPTEMSGGNPDFATSQGGPCERHLEFVFLLVTIAATVTHLIGMDYSFFTHARLLYGAPLMFTTALTGSLIIERVFRSKAAAWAVCVTLPTAALAVSTGSFHEDVPMTIIPWFLHDPMATALAAAAIVWWIVSSRWRSAILFHAANACLLALAYRLVPVMPARFATIAGAATRAGVVPMTPILIAYLGAIYFLLSSAIRRSRSDGVIGVACGGVATILLVSNRYPADGFWTCMVLGWSAWLCIHLAESNARRMLRLAPLAFLCAADITFLIIGRHESLVLWHAAAMSAVLVAAGSIFPATHYQIVAAACVLIHGGTWVTRQLLESNHPRAVLASIAGFLLLSIGILISWNKERLLARLPANPESNEWAPE